jgi:hypothetical protein
VTWRLAPIIGLVALLCPIAAKAQTNLDQGKTPSQIFANACVECHKEPRGLARGRSASALTEFLREHYTTNGQQAASLAAYVLGGRSADTPPPATQGRGPTPVPERASVEEPKPNRQGRSSSKPEERSTRNPAAPTTRPGELASPNEQPSIMRPVVAPAAAAHNGRKDQRVPAAPTPSEPDGMQAPAATAHNGRKDQRVPAAPTPSEPDGMQAPAAAAVEPVGAGELSNRASGREQSSPATSAAPTQAAPAESAPAASGENSAAPRDQVPD